MAYPQLPDIMNQLALAAAYPLRLISVSDPGVPNQERVNLRAIESVPLVNYFLMTGISLPDNRALPIADHSLWLGDQVLDARTWIVVYTCPGIGQRFTTMAGSGEPTLVLHWGKTQTLFHDQRVVPLLLRLDPTATQIGKQ